VSSPVNKVGREDLLARTFVELADTLVDEFDIVDLTQTLVERCVELFDASAAGVLLADPDGHLRLLACSSERLRVVELFEVQAQQGPCLDCYRSGLAVISQDLDHVNGRWPQFAPAAFDAGYRSVHALPVRLRQQVVGALNLFRSDPGPLDALDASVAQALADVTAIAIIQQRALDESHLLADELRVALDSRILIEQAKGMLAVRAQLSFSDAFAHIRDYARRHDQHLSVVCQAIIDRTISLNDLKSTPSP
jgi:GAF domain-containing protein